MPGIIEVHFPLRLSGRTEKLEVMAGRLGRVHLGLRRVDPFSFFGAVISLILFLVDDPWWSLQGEASSNLLSIQISPYYLKTIATGISETVPFAGPLGFATRIIIIMGFVSLVSASVRPDAWWHDLASYFGMSALIELFLSFLLMLHAAETTILGAYGTLPPISGTGQLSGSIIGLDLAIHFQPLVTSGFSVQLYLGLACSGLLGLGLVSRSKRKKRMKGVEALFTAQPDKTESSDRAN